MYNNYTIKKITDKIVGNKKLVIESLMIIYSPFKKRKSRTNCKIMQNLGVECAEKHERWIEITKESNKWFFFLNRPLLVTKKYSTWQTWILFLSSSVLSLAPVTHFHPFQANLEASVDTSCEKWTWSFVKLLMDGNYHRSLPWAKLEGMGEKWTSGIHCSPFRAV